MSLSNRTLAPTQQHRVSSGTLKWSLASSFLLLAAHATGNVLQAV